MKWNIKYTEDTHRDLLWKEVHITTNERYNEVTIMKFKETCLDENDGCIYRIVYLGRDLRRLLDVYSLPDDIYRHKRWDEVFVTNILDVALGIVQEIKEKIKT